MTLLLGAPLIDKREWNLALDMKISGRHLEELTDSPLLRSQQVGGRTVRFGERANFPLARSTVLCGATLD